MKVSISFTGGLETLFHNKRQLTLDIDPSTGNDAPYTIQRLINHLIETEMDSTKDKEMFLQNGHVRPGILVLINDADWELEGEEEYQVQPNDNILFASTLHGG